MNRAGARAEDLCAELLRKAGLRILARNWRCRQGEIDLVAEEDGTLVFAEVRLRRDARFGGAAESVTAAKRPRWSRPRACTWRGRAAVALPLRRAAARRARGGAGAVDPQCVY